MVHYFALSPTLYYVPFVGHLLQPDLFLKQQSLELEFKLLLARTSAEAREELNLKKG